MYDKFTSKESDYLKKDILNTLNVLFKDNVWKKINKVYLFNVLKDYYSKDKNVIVPQVVYFTRNFMNEKNLDFLKESTKKIWRYKNKFFKR